MKKLLQTIFFALIATSSFACGSDGGTGHHNGHEHGEDGEHDHYTPGMQRFTEQDLYEVTLYSDPGPPAMGSNTLSLGIADAAGTPVKGATITIVPSMPGHGHGSDDIPVITEEPDSNGVYRAENVSLHMLGIWAIELVVDATDGVDIVEFRFDVK